MHDATKKQKCIFIINVYSIKISMWITYQFQTYNCTHISTCISLFANITYRSSHRVILYKYHNSLINFKYLVNSFLKRLSFIFSFKKRWHNCIQKSWSEVSLSIFFSFWGFRSRFRVRNISRCQFVKSNKDTRVWWTGKVMFVPECSIRCSAPLMFLKE